MSEQTLVIIKPDAIEKGIVGKIITRFERKGFLIKRIGSRQKNATWCRSMYSHLYRRPDIFVPLCKFMTIQPIIGIILEGPFIVETVRRMIGETDSRAADPGTIRGDYGTFPIRFNCVHASDNSEKAKYEIELFFND